MLNIISVKKFVLDITSSPTVILSQTYTILEFYSFITIIFLDVIFKSSAYNNNGSMKQHHDKFESLDFSL